MDIFSILAVNTRREILELLARKGSLTATQICDKFDTSAPSISQHLKILQEARLIKMTKSGQQRIYNLQTDWLLEFDTWARRIIKLQEEKMDRLEEFLDSS